MKNLTIRRLTERGEQLFRAARDEGERIRYGHDTSLIWRGMIRSWKQSPLAPAFQRYLRYVRYRNNLKRLGIG